MRFGFLVAAVMAQSTIAFVPSSSHSLRSQAPKSTKLYSAGGMLPRHGSTPPPDDIEEARRRLEKVVQERPLPERERPPLTSIGRERRLVEIQLLENLDGSDEPLDDLWALWCSERGPAPSRELRKAEEMTMDQRQWGEVEQVLRDLIHENGKHWVEPVNRLATLLYMQGRLEESKHLCEVVLEEKPWHVGALSGIVMVCAGLNDVTSARYWAARRLPPIQATGSNRRRSEWSERAVMDAKNALKHAEGANRRAFGKKETFVPPASIEQEERSLLETDDSGDAWQ